jgi:hypothetical protein
MRNVICMKWGEKYGSEYVNVLNSMTRRHLSGAFRFVCFTDNPVGLDAHIETLPIPQCNLPNRPETEAWRKLSLFQSDIGISGDTLFLDLDLVITGSLDAFFDYPGTFCIIHNWTHPERRVGNSSLFRFVAGAHTDVFEQFTADPDGIARKHRNEQLFFVRMP